MKLKKILTGLMVMAVALSLTLYGTAPVEGATGNSIQKSVTAEKVIKGTELKNIRVGGDAKHTRIVMDLSSAKKINYAFENNNTRLVINIDGVYTAMKAAPDTNRGAVKDLILATYGDTVQLIVDMKVPVPVKVYPLKNPDRVVIDLINEYEEETSNQVEAGLLYGKYVRFDSRGMLTAYTLEVDPQKFDIRMVLPGGEVTQGLGKLSTIAQKYNAVAAVNGGYFDWSGTFLIGDIRINGTTVGMVPEERSGLINKKDGRYDVGQASYSGTVSINGQGISFWGVNSPRGKDAVILYNRLYGTHTGTNEFGKEFVIRHNSVAAINNGNSEIPSDGAVVSVHGQSLEYFKNVRVGDRAEIIESFGEAIPDNVDFYGAGPQLVKNGRVDVTSYNEGIANDIANGRAPRTAVGIKPNGHVILMVVDGRQSHSIGATLPEMGQLLIKYGADRGVNFDGGGSSEMVINNQIVTSPSGGTERKIGNALVVVRK